MAKFYLRNSVMQSFAMDAAHLACPGEVNGEFSVEFQLEYTRVLEKLQAVDGVACQPGSFPNGGFVTVDNLVFLSMPGDYIVDQAAAGIVSAPQGLILAK